MIQCGFSAMSDTTLVASLLTQTATGEKALRTVKVTDPVDNLDCEQARLGFDMLWKLAVGVGLCGKPALRIAEVSACALDGVECGTPINSTDDLLKQIFAYEPVSKTFVIRLAI